MIKQFNLIDYRGKIKDNEKTEKYLNLARELKKLEYESEIGIIGIAPPQDLEKRLGKLEVRLQLKWCESFKEWNNNKSWRSSKRDWSNWKRDLRN